MVTSKVFFDVIRRISFFIVILPLALLYQKLNIYHSPDTIMVSTIIDQEIPFVPEFVVAYLSWYLFISLGSVLLSVRANKDYYRYLTCLVIGWFICCLFFYFLPVEIIRPAIVRPDDFSQTVQYLYTIDGTFNCLPSTHVLVAALVTLFLTKYYHNFYIRLITVIWFWLICFSTLFIKQHYMFDIIAAIVLALILFGLANGYVRHAKKQPVMAKNAHVD